jgi:flagellar basal-body rod protein FlgF
MDTTAYLALSRQVALMRDMSVIANNVANVATTGFRGEHTLFESMLRRAGEAPRLAFVQDVGTARDMSQGPMTATGNPLDLAVDGDGWLAFATADGVRYSRAGHLEIDAGGQLVDAAGNPLLDDAGAPLTVPADDRDLTIAPDGTVSNRAGALGRIGLAAFPDARALIPAGGNLWAAEQPPAASTARLAQGMLEGSNVQPVLEMTRMIETTRAFEGTQRLIETHHDIERRAIERVLAAA